MTLPEHGLINCQKCKPLFNRQSSRTWGGNGELCRLINIPGSWGASEPKYLILGFSKGPNQIATWEAYENGILRFEDIPFSDHKKERPNSLSMRNRLKLLLVELGLMDENEDINQKFLDGEKSFSFGAIIRCSLAVLSDFSHGNKYTEQLNVIIETFDKDSCSLRILTNCVNEFLTGIPKNTLIIMLGLNKSYIKEAKKIFASIYGNLTDINQLGYTDGSRTWVHVAHPSGNMTDKQYENWVKGVNKNKKIELVKMAIQDSKRGEFRSD